mgnify:FL=1
MIEKMEKVILEYSVRNKVNGDISVYSGSKKFVFVGDRVDEI